MRVALLPFDPVRAQRLRDAGVEVVERADGMPDLPRHDVVIVSVGAATSWDAVDASRRDGRAVVVLGDADVMTRALDAGLEAGPEDAPGHLLAALARAATRRRFLPFYERMLELSGDAVEISGPDVHLLRVNPAFERTTGYRASEAVGKTPKELFRTGHQSSAHFAAVNAAVNRGEVWRGEVVDRREGGLLAIVYTTVAAVEDDGVGLGYLVTKAEAGHDSAAAASTGAEQRTRTLLEGAGDAVFVVTPDGKIIDVNRAAVHTLEHPREALIQRNLFDLLVDRDAATWLALFESLVEDGSTTVESRFADRGGEPQPVELRLTRTSVAMESIVLVLARDIRDRKAAELALQTLNARLEREVTERTRQARETATQLAAVLDNMVDGLVSVTPRGLITVINPAAERMLRIHDLAEHSVHGLGIDPLVAAVRSCLDEGEATRGEFELPDGGVVLATASPIRGSDGVITGCVTLLRDVTLEREIDRMKTDFIATVSHELRTPLTSVLGFAKLVRHRLQDRVFPFVDASAPKTARAVRQIDENLGIIVSEGARLTALINDVLDISKMESGRVEWAMELVDLAEVVDAATHATASLFSEGPVGILTEIVDGAQVRGDRNRLVQVLINLLGNARKFTKDGQVTVRLTCSDGLARIAVIDTGVGIEASDHEAIFERFHQLGDTLTAKPVGTGLGLPICKKIVLAHGGTITVDSDAGVGSQFTVSLPLGA